MHPSLLAALIAATATAAGWIVTSALASRAERRRRRAEARLKHIEQQLEQLYGPLLFLVMEGRSAWEDFCKKFGREVIFSNYGQLAEEEKALWLFWVDHEFMPRNEAIQSLLSSKTHLIVGARMPDSFMAFIEHYNAWRVTHLRWKNEGVPYSWHSKVNWPMKFETDVIESYERLKNLQIQMADLVRGIGD